MRNIPSVFLFIMFYFDYICNDKAVGGVPIHRFRCLFCRRAPVRQAFVAPLLGRKDNVAQAKR